MSPIDHVELFVPDRREAAKWYQRVLGLEVIPEYEHWALDPHGPLMISNDGGRTKLALFAGEPQGSRETAGFHLVAFAMSGEGFLRFVAHIGSLDLTNQHGNSVTAESVRDHKAAWSIYFNDPYGHRLEVTTYDYETVKAGLNALKHA
jgi:catechol 2,3-dioxygenase-like lactoylglutathione lyase family enzyme